MRDCVFLVADRNMEAVFRGFLSREQSHKSLGTRAFDFDPDIDIVVDAGGADPGVFSRGHELLRPYSRSHRFAVVALDCAWAGSPGASAIVDGISSRMAGAGWSDDRFVVIAIDPEVEVWMWQDNVHVASALQYQGTTNLRRHMQANGWWPDGADKPPEPKEAMEWVLRSTRRRRSSVVYREIAESVSVRQCKDDAFQRLIRVLGEWFPRERI